VEYAFNILSFKLAWHKQSDFAFINSQWLKQSKSYYG
jgi:hypothetical protein